MTRVDGRYELLERLGEGTFGEVWKAQDTRFGARIVAVKFLKGEILRHSNKTVVGQVIARFDAEAEALARVAHANVVAVIDRGQWQGSQYIVMEHIEGDSLAVLLDVQFQSGQPTDPATVYSIFDQICAGVEAAHDVTDPGPIVHRDLKPDNVMVRRDARGRFVVKVLDFGIARLGAGGMTMAGPLGTLHYMPPEQGLGDVAEMGPPSDVFALGAMLVEMLTGLAQPDDEVFWWQFVLKREREVRGWLASARADIPKAVWAVAARALRRDPARRYPNAFALREALAQALRTDIPDDVTDTPTAPEPVAPSFSSTEPPTAPHGMPSFTLDPDPVTVRPAARPSPADETLGLLYMASSVRTLAPDESKPVALPVGWHGELLPIGLFRGGTPGTYVWEGPVGIAVPMIWLPPDTAILGTDGGRLDEAPRHPRVFPRGFWIARFPVTVGDYEGFVSATGYITASESARDGQTWRNPGFSQGPKHPVVCLHRGDALAYCAWAGLRLPSEYEWEYTARGTDGRTYPWGEEPPSDERLVWSGRGERQGSEPVGTCPLGASPAGALDMVGNVLEWTSSRYLPYVPDAPMPDDREGTALDSFPRVIRGGCWCHDTPFRVEAAYRTSAGAGERYDFLGFRCALSASAEEP